MNALGQALEDYLRLRRALGFKLERHGRLLPSLVTHLESAGAATVTTQLALAWATAVDGKPGEWAIRLSIARGFAAYLQSLDPATEVPPADLLPRTRRRANPYLYTEAEIAALMNATATLRFPLNRATYKTVIGLLATTGIRIGELITLDRDDLDREQRTLLVRNAKFADTRLLPLHKSRRTGRLRRPARRAVPATRHPGVLRLHRRHPARLPERLRDLPAPGANRRPGAPLGALSPAAPRLQAPHGRGNPDRLVSPRRRRRGPAPGTVDVSRAHQPGLHLLVRLSGTGTARLGGRPARARTNAPAMTQLAPTLEAYFTLRLIGQRQASPHTVASYRDAFKLLLAFAAQQTGRPPSRLQLEDLDAKLIGAFLDHLETERGNAVRTRNARLAALHSMFRFAALRHPEHAALIARVLAIPPKRTERAIVQFLSEDEIDALLASPDRSRWIGRRDHALLLVAIETGLRVSELVGLRRQDVVLGSGAHVRCFGKGRKERVTPLTAPTVAVLRAWLHERQGEPSQPLFPASRGGPLSRDAVERLLAKHCATAAQACPALLGKKPAPHVLRHSCAVQLRRAGVDQATLALWLGHESVRTTDIYNHADLSIKEQALARTRPRGVPAGRYKPSDTLLAFLEGL